MRGRHLIVWAFWVAGIAGSAAALGAAVGTAFTYQGQLKAGGMPVNGFVDLSFGLYDAETGGSQIGSTELACHVEVVNGLLTAEVDFGKGAFDDTPRWLAVGVRNPSTSSGGVCDGSGYVSLDPRQKVNPAPQSWYSFISPWSGLEGVPAGFADGIDNEGSLTLPFEGSFTGDNSHALSITQKGLGSAARFMCDDPGNFFEALFASSAGAGPSLFCIKGGDAGGHAGSFLNTNPANAFPTVFVKNEGVGACLDVQGGLTSNTAGINTTVWGNLHALRATNRGTARAGWFEITNPANNESALYVKTIGTAEAGFFEYDNSSAGFGVRAKATSNNGSSAAVHGVGWESASGVRGVGAGSGDGVVGLMLTGTGRAGYFSNGSVNSVKPAVEVVKAGRSGNALDVRLLNPENGSSAIRAETAGTGRAGFFKVDNTSNSNTALVVLTNGTGRAALFQSLNSRSSEPAVLITQSGPGLGLEVRGNARVEVLEILGGSDLSEGFDVLGETVLPGMVVVIDPDAPGKLTVSTTAYDRKVAGIVSGAGGVKTGMLMGQRGTVASGDYPVALTGRVYGLADASGGAIEPGDLLTTSCTVGHVMKVTDFAKAHGAVIGKAMTPLSEGTGLVLILVNLQ